MIPRRPFVLVSVLALTALVGCGQKTDTDAAPADTTSPAAPSTSTAAATTSGPSGVAGSPSGTDESPDASGPAGTSQTTTEDGSDETATRSGAPTGQTTATTSAGRSAAASSGDVPERDPGDYGDAALNALSSGDTSRASRYLSPSARTRVGTPPKGPLTRVACEDDMCSYTSAGGQRVTLTFDLATVQAGKGGGIVGVKVD